MSKLRPTATSLLIILLGSILLHYSICQDVQFTERPKIEFGKPFNINSFTRTLTLLNAVTVAEAGFIKNQDAGTKQDKNNAGVIPFDDVVAEAKKADTNFEWREDIGKESTVQFYVKDSNNQYYYSRFEFIQPSESNVPGKCMQFDIEVSYQKNDPLNLGQKKKFVESEKVKPGEDKTSQNAKKAVSITNLSEKQTIKLKKKSTNQECPGQAGLTVEKIQISPQTLKSTEDIFNGKEKLPPTECTKASITCTDNDPARCSGQTECEKIKDDVEEDTIVCHQSTGAGETKLYTGCKVNQKGDSSKPTFEKKTMNPRFTAMGKDMASGNTPSGGNAQQDVELTTADFNYDQFDQNGCIKLQASIWLSNNKFTKTEIEQCIDPCKLAKKLYSELPADTEPFKQKGGFDGNKKVNTNETTQDAKVKWESSVKTPQFVQKSLFMELDNKSNQVDEKVTFIDSKGKNQNNKGGKERYINQRGLSNNQVEFNMKDLIQSSGYDGEEESSLGLKCQNEDGTIEDIGPKQKLPEFKVPDEHSCMKLKVPKFKTLDGKQLKSKQVAKPKQFEMPKQPMNLELELDDSRCVNGEKADQYKIIDIEIRTYDDLEKDKDFYNKVEFVRMGCNAMKCQVLDAGEDQFLEIPAGDCVTNDSNYTGKKVCTYTDPESQKTKKFVQSVGPSGSSIDYSAWTTCQAGSSGDCQTQNECKKGTKSTSINFDTDCSAYKALIQTIRDAPKEDLSSLGRAPGVDYNDKLLSVTKTQRKPQKKLSELTEKDLDVGKIPLPSKAKDGSLQIPEGGFKKQTAKVDTGEKAPTKPQKAGEIPDVDQQLSIEWRINPFEVKDGKVDENKDLVPKDGRTVYVFAIIKKLDSASPTQTVIKLVKEQIKLFNREIKESAKPKIQFQSTNEIEMGTGMKFKAKILGGRAGETYTLRFQKIDKETNQKDGEVFQVGVGSDLDVDISPGEVSKMFGYRRDNIDVSFEVYDSNGILITDERVEIKTKLPEKTSPQLECVTFKEFACYKGSDISELADRDPENVPIVTDTSDLSCTPVISTENCEAGKFANLEVTQVIARTNKDIKEEYWKKGLDQAPDKECKERPIICTSEIEVIQGDGLVEEVKELRCRDMYNSKDLEGVTSRKDSKGKAFYRAQARKDEQDDEKKFAATERTEKVVDKQKTQERPTCYILNPEKPNILSPDSPCAKLADPAAASDKKEANCPLQKKCYDLLVSQEQDIRDDAECRKQLQDWADSFDKGLSFQDQYESENKLNDYFEEEFDEQLPYFVTIKGEWFMQKNQYFDFFLKVILNDGEKVFTLDSPARIYVANKTPPSRENWVDLKMKPAPTVVDWNTPFTYTPAALKKLSDDTDLSDTTGYRVILQKPNAMGNGFEDVSATDIGSQISIDFSDLFKVYQLSREENDFGEKQLIDIKQEESDQTTQPKIPEGLSDFKKKLYEEKLAQENFKPEEKYGEKKQSLRFFRLLLEYPNGFTVPTPIKVTIKPPTSPTNKPTGCIVNTAITVKYDNTDAQAKNQATKTILSSERSSAFDINVDLSGCSAWTGYSVYDVELRDYDDLQIENGFRGAANKGAAQCITTSIGCANVKGNGQECFDLQSNKVTARQIGAQTVYDNQKKECFIKDQLNLHPLEKPENAACITTNIGCVFEKRCFYDSRFFKSEKCLQYKKMLTFEFENRKTPTQNNNAPQKTADELKVESKINEKLGKAKLEKKNNKVLLFVERFGDDIERAGSKMLTFHIALTKNGSADVYYIKQTKEFDIWKPTGVPTIQMTKNNQAETSKIIFRDWGSTCDFTVETQNQDPTLQLSVRPKLEKKKKSEDKFDNGEDNLTNLASGQSLNQKQCFETFGVAAKQSGAKMKVDVFNGIDKVGEKSFDIVLRAPSETDIKAACTQGSGNRPAIEIYEEDVSTGSAVRGSKLTKNNNKFDISFSKQKNVIVKVVKNNSCSAKPDFKIILSYAQDLSKEQCLYNDPSCKDLGDCEKIPSIPCDGNGCTIQGEKNKIPPRNQNDQSSNSIKRVDGQFDCYVEVQQGVTPFNGKKSLPSDKPKFEIPFQQGPNAGELKIDARSTEFLKRVLSGDVKLYAHVFQYDKNNAGDNVVDYYQTEPIMFKIAKPGLQFKDIQGSNKESSHPNNKDVFLRPTCQNPGAQQDGRKTTITTKYECPAEISQTLCDQSAGKSLNIPKSELKNLTGSKSFSVICQETDENGQKTEVRQNVSITFDNIPDCPKFQLFPEQLEINDEKLKKLDKVPDLFKLKIKIDKTACPNVVLNGLTFSDGGDSVSTGLKPTDDNALGSNNTKQITKVFTKAELQAVKHKKRHSVEATLTFDTSTTIKARFNVFRAAAELKGKAKGANRMFYKGDSVSFDVEISDDSLDAGLSQDYETEIVCPTWISQDLCDEIPGKDFQLDERITDLIPADQLGKPQKFEFKMYASDGREISIPASITLLDASKKSQNLPQIIVRRDNEDSKYAKYGEVFFYATALNSETGLEQAIDLDAWDLSWRFSDSATDQDAQNIEKFPFEDTLTVDLEKVRSAGSKGYRAELTLTRKSDGFNFKTSQEVMTSPPPKQGKMSLQQKETAGKAKRHSFNFEQYDNIDYFEIRCVEKGKSFDDRASVTKTYVTQDGAFEDISLPNSEDNDCYNIAKDTNGNVQTQQIQYTKARKAFANKTQALDFIDVDNLEQLLLNPFFEQANDNDKGEMFKSMSQKLDTDFQGKKGADGYIPKAQTRSSINSLKSFMKNLDIKDGLANKADIESKTLSSFELVADSAINAIDTLTDADLQSIFECIFEMEEELSLSETSRSSAKTRKHEMIKLKLANSREGQVQKVQTSNSKMMYSKFTPSTVKNTVEFQASSTDPKVKLEPSTLVQIGSDASVSKVNVVATSSNKIPTEIQTDAAGNKLQFPMQKTQNVEVTSQDGKEVSVSNLSTGKEVKIDFPTMTLDAGKECQGNFVNESTSKLDQTGVTCQFDTNTNVPTVKSTHMTTFTVTLKTNGSTQNPPVDDNTSSSSDGLSAGAIAGIAIGAVVFVTGVVLLTVFLVKRAKAKKLRRNGGGTRMSVLQEDGSPKKKNQVAPDDESSTHHIPTEQRLEAPVEFDEQ